MFPQRLKELRKERRLTAREFGSKFSLAESTISGYETGARKPDIDLVDKFADFFGVSVDYIMGRTDTRDNQHVKSEGRAYYGGGNDWTDEERQLAQAAVEDWRRRKKEMEQKLQQNKD